MSFICVNRISLLLILSLLAGCNSGSDKDQNIEQVRDIDENFYNIIQIGNQVWMSENLKTTTYSDGTPIPMVEDYEEWASLSLPAYSWYNNDSLNAEDYGALYNFYAVESEKLCPDGWHVPSDEDWIELESFLGVAESGGGALKEEGISHWKTPNAQATNVSGFTARPGGYRSYNGTFNLIRIDGFWWSSSVKNWYGQTNRVVYRNLKYDEQGIFRPIAEKANGFSVRCIQNPSK